ncbi:MAG: hypothetical protein ACI4MJ_10240 [Aristaeellaceae bacterium]
MNLEQDLVLAYMEEDDVQRAHFRVRPLITCHGDIQEEAVRLWPDEGCLRILPDRAEQHTFKERMRAMGHYCVVDLRAVSADSGKIRTNKNYRPERGELNQFILYSDTVKPLPAHSFFEVVSGTAEEAAALAEKAITPLFYIRTDDTLFGPVRKEHPEPPQPAAEAAGTLVPLEDPEGVHRLMLCMPSDEPIPVPVPAKPAPAKPAESAQAPKSAQDKTAESAQPPKPAPAKPAESAQPPKPAQDKPAKPVTAQTAKLADDTPLPLGKRLTILDEDKTFDETLQGLDQPLSQNANLLHARQTPQQQPRAKAQPKVESAAPLNGTPLHRSPLKTSVPQPKNKLQEYVSSQWRVSRYEPPTESLPAGTAMRHVVNPVETACQSLREAWAMEEAQTQLLDLILSLDGMCTKLLPRLALSDGDTPLQRVILTRLQDMEAERLSALIQLDQAKADLEAFRKSTVDAMQGKQLTACRKLEEKQAAGEAALAVLKEQLAALAAQRDALQARVDELQQAELPSVLARMMADAQLNAPVSGVPLRMNSVAGIQVSGEELVERVCSAVQACGASMTRSEAAVLLALLAVSPRIGLSCAAPAVAATLLRNIAAALGWLSSYAQQISPEEQPLPCTLMPDGTPAVLLTALPNYAPIPSVSKLMIARTANQMTRTAAYDVAPWPVFPLKASQTIPEVQMDDVQPVSAASLQALLEQTNVPSEQIEQILAPLTAYLPALSGSAKQEMFRFVGVGTRLLSGDLPAAMDWALLLWFMPALERTPQTIAALKPLLQEYPLSLAQL